MTDRNREYRRWRHMLDRCTNPDHPHYAYWGGRGITVCERWHDFNAYFEDILLIGPCPPRMSLDRIDNDRGYEPGNVRWATGRQQLDNSRGRGRGCIDRHQQYAELRGDGMPMEDAARAVGIDPWTTGYRYERWVKSGAAFT